MRDSRKGFGQPFSLVSTTDGSIPPSSPRIANAAGFLEPHYLLIQGHKRSAEALELQALHACQKSPARVARGADGRRSQLGVPGLSSEAWRHHSLPKGKIVLETTRTAGGGASGKMRETCAQYLTRLDRIEHFRRRNMRVAEENRVYGDHLVREYAKSKECESRRASPGGNRGAPAPDWILSPAWLYRPIVNTLRTRS